MLGMASAMRKETEELGKLFRSIRKDRDDARKKNAQLRADNERLRAALADMWAAHDYIVQVHGKQEGVGYDRMYEKALYAMSQAEKEQALRGQGGDDE